MERKFLQPRVQKDNKVIVPASEWRYLKGPKVVGPRKFILGNCPALDKYGAEHVPEMAHILARMYAGQAVANGCGIIVVKQKRWHYEFHIKDLNRFAAKHMGVRRFMPTNEMETKLIGGKYDTTRDLYQVPKNYNLRESITFPVT